MPNLYGTTVPFAMPETGYVLEAGAMDWKGSPRRLIYPAKEKITNEANYNEAVARLKGGDVTTARMWWDSRTAVED
ncbi:MAG: SusD/RagB family nutrient-binding outer membrane lipoprotein [Candidatus Cryptobacteroides sp.]